MTYIYEIISHTHKVLQSPQTEAYEPAHDGGVALPAILEIAIKVPGISQFPRLKN